MAGTVYNVAPIPPEAEHTTYVDAGVLKFGVEFRLLDDAELAANYRGPDMQEIQAAVAAKGNDVEDDGVSIHVVASDNDHEYLRFDMFERQPHYHYIDPAGPKNTIVEYDAVAMGEMLPWVLNQLRTRLAEMLAHAGGGALVGKLDDRRTEEALREVEGLVRRAVASRLSE